MMIENIKNMIYNSTEKNAFRAEVLVAGQWYPCVLASYDIESHIIDGFTRAIAGEFGEIADYEQPIVSDDELAQQIRAVRDTKLVELDSIVSNPLRWASLSEEQQQLLGVYRQKLLDVPQQSGFPTDVIWPENPIESVSLS